MLESEPSPKDPKAAWPAGAPHRGAIVGGKYVCEGVIGAGGMGSVLSGRHMQLGNKVAIKILLPSALKDPLANERFLREARAAIVLRSHHIARVIDFGTLDSGSPYLIMEHLEGCDLKDILARKGPLPVESAVDFIMQACEALCEAHRRGIVHRDLKPANLFLSSRVDGTPFVKVLDFGISKTIATAAASSGSGSGITKTDAVFGTPAYMSPEQLRSSKLVDHRTDIWSLGVTLFELLTGKLPFGSADDGVAAMCVHILEDAPPMLPTLRPEIPQELDEAVRRCVHKDPGARYASIAEVAEALAPFGSDVAADTASRIARMSLDSLPFDSTIKGDSYDHVSGRTPGTRSAWGSTGAPTRRKKLVSLGALAAAASFFALAVGGAWWIGNRRAAAGAGSAASASHTIELPGGESAEPVAPDTPAPAAPTSATAGAPEVAASSSAAAPTAAAPPAKPAYWRARPAVKPSARPKPETSSPPAQPTCEPGRVLSNGHCCVTGFEWKGGACVPGVAKGL